MLIDACRLIGSSHVVRTMERAIESAARSDAEMLISGERGVGKEMLARLIHGKSARSGAAFVTLNCTGVPETLLESVLFGHRQGSFVGAYCDRPGLLQTAHLGTLFIDESCEMSLRMQGLLLGFLETGDVQRVGDDRPESRVDVRIIAATNRDLKERIQAKAVREDLYDRLNVTSIAIPPLRERAEDIGVLVEHFLAFFGGLYHVERPRFSRKAAECMSAYRWPCNVRELKNLVEQLVVTAPGRLVDVADLPRGIREAVATPSAPPPSTGRAVAIGSSIR